MSSRKGKELPIFSKQKVNFTPKNPLTHICVANEKLVLAMQNKVILRIDLKDPENQLEVDLGKMGIEAKISNIFLDPSGFHILIAFSPLNQDNPAELVYLPPKGDKLKAIPSMRSHSVTAVGWNPKCETSTPTSTSPFLLGTSKGLIFEADISSSEVKVYKQLYDISTANSSISKKGNIPAVISGLEYFFIPGTQKCVVLAATGKNSTLYQFQGSFSHVDDRPFFANIFNSYLNQSSREEFLEFGNFSSLSDQSGCKLHVNYDNSLNFPNSIGFLTDSGSFVYNKIASTDVNFLSNGSTLLNSKENNLEGDDLEKSLPKTILLTGFHALLLYKDSVKAVSLLNEELIFQENFEGRDKILNIVRDPIKGSIWSITEGAVHKFIVNREDRNVWKIYLEKKLFAQALDSCKNDPEAIEKSIQIHMKQADFHFEQKEYDLSAMYYAMTNASFEEIALKFVQIDDTNALRTLLLKKLSSLQSHETTKLAALILWVVELYLNELGSLRDFGKGETAEYHNLEEEFLKFMSQPRVKECAKSHKAGLMDLMSSHGDKANLIHFTLEMKDFDEVIENNILNGQIKAALTTLRQQKDSGLYSRFIPILLDKDPKATIDVLIESGRMLNPIKLLPKFSSKLDKTTAKEMTRYLEHCVKNLRMTDQPLHDYLLSLYTQYNDSSIVMNYLKNEGNDPNRVHYDPKYALSLSLEKDLKLPTIHLYTIMGLYEDAVDLALQFDLELAKKTANKPEGDEDLRKRLWLKIAKHVVKEKNDIKEAMEFLHQSDLLKIEDVLPFFPSFVTIDHFKDAICSSLQEYNKHIQDLKDEMDEATKAAEILREDIHAVRNRCAIVRGSDQCTLCQIPLLTKNFYVFPCGHQFHADCLMGEVYPQLSQPRRALLSDHQRRLNEMSIKQEILSTGSAVISARDQIKADIDDIIASECIYCGDNMIKLIDTPFIPEADFDRIQKEWE